jgi:hypothetical protein
VIWPTPRCKQEAGSSSVARLRRSALPNPAAALYVLPSLEGNCAAMFLRFEHHSGVNLFCSNLIGIRTIVDLAVIHNGGTIANFMNGMLL